MRPPAFRDIVVQNEGGVLYAQRTEQGEQEERHRKGGTAAPARFTLNAQQGRGRWPWADSANEGKRYLLFLSPASGGFTVARCGQSGAVSDSERSELRAEGLTPTQR